MKFRAVLFDLDGTLLDTIADLASSVNAALATHGLTPVPVGVFPGIVGDGMDMMARRILPPETVTPEFLRGFIEEVRKEYALRWKDETTPYPGIPALLDALTARGVRMAVLSNKPHEFTDLIIRTILSRWRFERVLGLRPGMPRKPDPAGAVEIARDMDLLPSEIVFLGDSGNDMHAATAAGMYPVGALWGYRGRQEISEAGAAVLISSPEELLRLFDN